MLDKFEVWMSWKLCWGLSFLLFGVSDGHIFFDFSNYCPYAIKMSKGEGGRKEVTKVKICDLWVHIQLSKPTKLPILDQMNMSIYILMLFFDNDSCQKCTQELLTYKLYINRNCQSCTVSLFHRVDRTIILMFCW